MCLYRLTLGLSLSLLSTSCPPSDPPRMQLFQGENPKKNLATPSCSWLTFRSRVVAILTLFIYQLERIVWEDVGKLYGSSIPYNLCLDARFAKHKHAILNIINKIFQTYEEKLVPATHYLQIFGNEDLDVRRNQSTPIRMISINDFIQHGWNISSAPFLLDEIDEMDDRGNLIHFSTC